MHIDGELVGVGSEVGEGSASGENAGNAEKWWSPAIVFSLGQNAIPGESLVDCGIEQKCLCSRTRYLASLES